MTDPKTIHDAAATLLRLVRTALSDPDDSGEITRAAVALMDCTARPADDDDPNYVELADNLAERAALWAYGLRDKDFRRPHDELRLHTALRAYMTADRIRLKLQAL